MLSRLLSNNENIIATIAGNGTAFSDVAGDVASEMILNQPVAVWEDTNGVVYVVEAFGNCIRKFSYPYGIVGNSVGVCGSSSGQFGGDHGPASAANLNVPVAIVTNTIGEMYIADMDNNRIRFVSSGSIIATYAGGGTVSDARIDSIATSVTFNSPNSLWVDSVGVVYVTDYVAGYIRFIDTSNIVKRYSGTGGSTFSGNNGPASSATMSSPSGVYIDKDGGGYISDSSNNRVRQVGSRFLLLLITFCCFISFTSATSPTQFPTINPSQPTVVLRNYITTSSSTTIPVAGTTRTSLYDLQIISGIMNGVSFGGDYAATYFCQYTYGTFTSTTQTYIIGVFTSPYFKAVQVQDF